ncbi:MAG: hypothetical protein NMNS01_30640 [Nitrosomonas sp.]|nr:MAG: hypothetical protein NMNS01_30640 [Nitrosomonas sp.]
MAKVKRNLRPLLRFITLERTSSNQALLCVFNLLSQAFCDGLQLPKAEVFTAITLKNKHVLWDFWYLYADKPKFYETLEPFVD